MAARWDRGSGLTNESPAVAAADIRRAVDAPVPWHRGVDPYYRWAVHTKWRGFAVAAGWGRLADDQLRDIQIMVQAEDHQMLADALRQAQDQAPWLKVPEVYQRPIPDTGHRALHFTARVRKEDLGLLDSSRFPLRWELAVPLRDAERAAQGAAESLFGTTRDPKDFQAENVVRHEIRQAQPLRRPQSLGPTLAIIDFGCPFLNSSFATPITTRVVAVWDQGSDAAGQAPESGKHKAALSPTEEGRTAPCWPWQQPPSFGYGRELGPDALQVMVSAVKGPRNLEETRVYRGIDYLIDYDDPRRRTWFATHGGHVLDVAGGAIDPLTLRTGDPASQANLVFVQLPSLTAADASGGSLAPHLLDGVRYALDVCDLKAPLVVNVSYGTHAGSHDGSSMLDSALTELLAHRQNNFVVVAAAGNARQSRCHVRRSVLRNRSARLRCYLGSGDTTDTFVEIWYPETDASCVLQARVRPPSRLWSAWLSPNEEDCLRDDGSNRTVVGYLRHDRQVPNGGRSLILLALAPTAPPNNVPGALAEPGLWEIEVRMAEAQPDARLAPAAVELDAWIERDEPDTSTGGERSYFVDQTPDDELNTLSSVATGPYTIVAGGYNLMDGRPTSYSSLPQSPANDGGLMVLAACEEDNVNPNVRAAATRTGEVLRMNGTSVAAPVLSRRLFNRMIDGPAISRREWPQVLLELAQDPETSLVKPLPKG